MDKFSYFGLARAIHVIGVVLWIGGVAFVTTTLIPSLRKMDEEDRRLVLFEQLEGRFAFQAKIITVLTGLSGFYMLEYLNALERYLHVQFWWIHLMTLVWLIFTLVLFVLEPLVLHRHFKKLVTGNIGACGNSGTWYTASNTSTSATSTFLVSPSWRTFTASASRPT